MELLKLDPEFRQMLERIRTEPEQLNADDLDCAGFERAVQSACRKLLNDAGLGRMLYIQHEWFIRELAGALRTRLGWDLAFELELLVRKWQLRGLKPGFLQKLIRQAYGVLTGTEAGKLQAPNSKPQTPESSLPAAPQSEICNLQSEISAPESAAAHSTIVNCHSSIPANA